MLRQLGDRDGGADSQAAGFAAYRLQIRNALDVYNEPGLHASRPHLDEQIGPAGEDARGSVRPHEQANGLVDG